MFLTEDEARDYLERLRWPNGAQCPHCQAIRAEKLTGKSTRPGVYKCKNRDCRKQFTVTVGTIFERSHIPLRHWVMAFHLMCSSKKGVSAHQIHRSLGVTYKSAWFMCHRIRHAIQQGPFPEKLKGVVEADEIYVGGKPRANHRGPAKKKQSVVALVERGGQVRAAHMRVTAQNLRSHVKAHAEPSATLVTDGYHLYRKVGKAQAEHKVIRHDFGVYAKKDKNSDLIITTNTVESFFGLIKRGVYGVFHHVSPVHLHRYVDEFAFRWNHRKVNDGTRREAALLAVAGKRLTYK
jgi:transposase-like protein